MKHHLTILFFSTALWVSNSFACQVLPKQYISEMNLTVATTEQKSLNEIKAFNAKGLNAPLVPFGHLNKQWNRMKVSLSSNNQLVKFHVPMGSGNTLSGTQGYAIINGECIEHVLFTAIQ